MKPSEQESAYRIHPRPTAELTLRMPQEVLGSLAKVASEREMTVDALVRLYGMYRIFPARIRKERRWMSSIAICKK